MGESVEALGGPFRLVDSGVEITGDPTLEQWTAATTAAREMVRVGPLVLSQLLIYGRERWPEEYSQVLDGFDKRTVENYTSLMRKVSREVLAAAPSLGHADAVRSLPEAQQKEVIEEAKAAGLSVAETRRTVRVRRKRPAASGHANRDAEACQNVAADLRRAIWLCGDLAPAAENADAKHTFGAVAEKLQECVEELESAAQAALAETVQPKEG